MLPLGRMPLMALWRWPRRHLRR